MKLQAKNKNPRRKKASVLACSGADWQKCNKTHFPKRYKILNCKISDCLICYVLYRTTGNLAEKTVPVKTFFVFISFKTFAATKNPTGKFEAGISGLRFH
jgi:hypothetical protein